jgi:hypothetical protein
VPKTYVQPLVPDAAGRRQPVGQPLEGYFPRVIEAEEAPAPWAAHLAGSGTCLALTGLQ